MHASIAIYKNRIVKPLLQTSRAKSSLTSANMNSHFLNIGRLSPATCTYGFWYYGRELKANNRRIYTSKYFYFHRTAIEYESKISRINSRLTGFKWTMAYLLEICLFGSQKIDLYHLVIHYRLLQRDRT